EEEEEQEDKKAECRAIAGARHPLFSCKAGKQPETTGQSSMAEKQILRPHRSPLLFFQALRKHAVDLVVEFIDPAIDRVGLAGCRIGRRHRGVRLAACTV